MVIPVGSASATGYRTVTTTHSSTANLQAPSMAGYSQLSHLFSSSLPSPYFVFLAGFLFPFASFHFISACLALLAPSALDQLCLR